MWGLYLSELSWSPYNLNVWKYSVSRLLGVGKHGLMPKKGSNLKEKNTNREGDNFNDWCPYYRKRFENIEKPFRIIENFKTKAAKMTKNWENSCMIHDELLGLSFP